MPVDRHRTRRARSLRTAFVIALTSLLLLSACRATPSVEVTGAAVEDQATLQPDADAESQNSSALHEPAPTADTSAADLDEPAESSAEGEAQEPQDPAEPLFEVQGELPLTDREVNSLIRFIEEETGREFLRPPVIVAQSSEVFVAELEENVVDFEESADTTVRSLQALGLTTQGVAEATDAFLNLLLSPEGVQGYYDPEADELYVPIDSLGDDDFRSLLVHELTHALDGQHADLGALEDLADEGEITGDFEPVLGLQAVGEGRASSVQNRWLRANGIPQPDPSELDTLSIEAVPPAMVLSLSIPYAFGEQYIEGNGGPANTWELLDTPPTSSEAFMVPGAEGETVIDVAMPPADGPILDETVFGAADLFIWMLGESLEPTPTLIFPTFTAIDGWAGGQSVMWGDDAETCVRIAFAADTKTDLEEIQAVLEIWAGENPRRTVTSGGDLVTVTGCAPFVP